MAFHYRNADQDEAQKVVERILEGPATLPGVEIKHGKKWFELTVVSTNKGTAVEQLRRQVAAEAVLFIGDDVTDEDAFATLTGPDLGIKVGEGDTLAPYRLTDTEDTARNLAMLCEMRRAWLQGETAPSIERHSLLSDQRTVALVTPDAGSRGCATRERTRHQYSPSSWADHMPATSHLAGRWALHPSRSGTCPAPRSSRPAGRTSS